jgi:hypothetical protein
MVASCLSTPCALPLPSAVVGPGSAVHAGPPGLAARMPRSWRLPGAGRRRCLRAQGWPSPALLLSLVLAPTLLLVAAVAAPEQPQSQEAICQRHHGVEACRVW